MKAKITHKLFIIVITLMCSACKALSWSVPENLSIDGPPKEFKDISQIPDAIPQQEPLSHYGNPPSYAVNGKRYAVMHSSEGYVERGIASWYGTKFHKKLTSTREPYDLYGMTAAHPTLPLPTYLRVTNLENGRQVVVKVNDRGPFKDNRLIDLSYAAAKKLGITQKGTGLVEITAISSAFTDYPKSVPISNDIKLYLQFGAFAQHKNAHHYAEKIANITQKNVELVSASIPQGQIYRVQIGPIRNIEQSDTLVHLLKVNGIANAITVIR